MSCMTILDAIHYKFKDPLFIYGPSSDINPFLFFLKITGIGCIKQSNRTLEERGTDPEISRKPPGSVVRSLAIS